MKDRPVEKLTIRASSLPELRDKIDEATKDRVVHRCEQHTVTVDGVDEYRAEIVRSKKNYLTEG